MMVLMIFALWVVAVVALAEARARHASLEALAVVLSTLCAATVAPFEVVLLAFRQLHLKKRRGCLGLAPPVAVAAGVTHLNHLAVAEGVRVPH